MVNSIDNSADSYWIPESSVEPNSKYNYTTGTFVSVITETSEHDLPFWIAELMYIRHTESGVSNRLTVQCYELYNGSDTYRWKYRTLKKLKEI